MPRLSERIYFPVIVLIIFFVAVVVRLHHLDYDSFFMDEIHQAGYYQLPLSQVHLGSINQQQPPLDYWIGALVSRVSYSDFSLRLPASMFGAFTVVLIVLIVKEFSNKAIALLMGLIASILPYAVYVSQDARPYSIAIFFFCFFFYLTVKFLDKKDLLFSQLIFYFFVSYCLLMSRTLSPLVLVFVTGTYLFVQSILAMRKPCQAKLIKKLLSMQASLIAAFICYLPFFYKILLSGQKYLKADSSIEDFFGKLDIGDLYQVWQVQLEPLSSLFIVLAAFGVLLILVNRRFYRSKFIFLLYLLIGSSVIHYIVFSYNTAHQFRSSYSIYVYPLALVYAGLSLKVLSDYLRGIISVRLLNIMAFLISVFFLCITVAASLDFKKKHIKTDWRSLSSYLNYSDDGNKIYFMNMLAAEKHWAPGFYGANRYVTTVPKGRLLKLESFNQEWALALQKNSLKPVLVFFHYRNYFLTQNSKLGIFNSSFGQKDINWNLNSPQVNVVQLLGFTILELREGSVDDSTLVDLKYLIEHALATIPENSSTVGLHLAGSNIYRVLGDDAKSEYHFEKAKRFARKDQLKLEGW